METIIRNFNRLSYKDLFSANTLYEILDRTTRERSFINGVQAEGLVGLNHDIRYNLVNKRSDSFTAWGYFVKFFSHTSNNKGV